MSFTRPSIEETLWVLVFLFRKMVMRLVFSNGSRQYAPVDEYDGNGD